MKLTLEQIAAFTKAYVLSTSQASDTLTVTKDNLINAIDKIGKMVTIDGVYSDKLPELEGDNLPLGKTIEEWFIDLTLPQDYVDPRTDESFDPTATLKPYFPSTENCYYSVTLKPKFVVTSKKNNDVEKACLSADGVGQIVAKILGRLEDSYQVSRYQIKRQLLGNFATKANAKGLTETIAVPTDTATGEAFIKSVKNAAEVASDINEGNTLGDITAGASPSLTLYLKQGILSSLQVDTLAGAFNSSDLKIPANVKVIKDFGTIMSDETSSATDISENVYAILLDPRGVKLHNSYNAIRDDKNAAGDYVSYFRHYQDTGFISKNTFIKVYKKA